VSLPLSGDTTQATCIICITLLWEPHTLQHIGNSDELHSNIYWSFYDEQ
jgi:hypothetical protein